MSTDAVERCPPKENNIFLRDTLIILHAINCMEVWKADGLALNSPVSQRHECYKLNIRFFFFFLVN